MCPCGGGPHRVRRSLVERTDPRYYGDAVLALADGRVFRGKAFGARKTVVGEVVFNTSLTGYQEIVSDPSYTGQLVCLTMPEIGNVGANAEDDESKTHGAEALIVRTVSPLASNWRADESLDAYLRRRGIVGLAEIDTRSLTRRIRTEGAVGAALSTEHGDVDALVALARGAGSMEGKDLVASVTTAEPYTWTLPSWGTTPPPADMRVVVYDYGVKLNILRMLRDRGFECVVVPADYPVDKVLALDPDGVLLSNGPGDPAAVAAARERIADLLGRDAVPPVFGICLGHQLLCLALGGETYKMGFGHHGGNHPVRTESDQKVAITSQNHGFAVRLDSLGEGARLTHLNLFDETVAGLRMADRPVWSVQYHPEASPGPHDAAGLFGEFAELVRGHRQA